MQALRLLFQDGDVQGFADAGRDLAQQLLGQASAAGVGPGGPRKAVITGNHRFQFSLNFEARGDTDGFCQTGVLVASATAMYGGRAPGGSTLPLLCRWKRSIGERLVEIPGINDRMYHASADDIGMVIVCEAEVPGDPSMGIAYGRIGPFEIDPIARMNIENLISSGATSFPARHSRDNEQVYRDLQIRVTHEQVKVHHPDSRGSGQEVVASYSADYPKVILHPTETCKFKLELSADPDKQYKFVALSRNSRDLIALVIRTFHTRKYVATSVILNNLFQNPARPGAPLTSLDDARFDIHAVNLRLTKELNRTSSQLEALEKVLRVSSREKAELQEQLRETIGSYTEAIEQLHQQIANARGGPSAAEQVELHEKRSQHSKQQMDLRDAREKLEEERRRAPKPAEADAASESLRQELDGLTQDVQQLHARIAAMSGDKQDQSKRDITRAEELRRLRADLDMLVSEREELEMNNMRADKERAELIENFMYVKTCLDRVQFAQLEGPAASPEQESKLAQMKVAHRQLLEERNRLAHKVDSLDRDREKQKQQRETHIERVMTANARLLEERDKLEKEKARVSELYQHTMNAVGAASQGPSSDTALGAEGGSQRELLERLRAELAGKAEELAKRQQEGESLRSRLRRLAMVSE